MKNWKLRLRKTDTDIFGEIKSGTKSVETRAATIKYQPIEAGDTLTFVCGKESCTKRIVRKHHFKTVAAMTKKIPLKKIMPDIDSLAAMKKRYASYPGYEEKIQEHGLFAFELE